MRATFRLFQVLAVLLVSTLVFAACGFSGDEDTATDSASDGGGDDGSFDAPTEEAMEEPASMEGDAMEEEEAMDDSDSGDVALTAREASDSDGESTLGTGGSGNGSAPGALQPLDIGRDIIFTARISVQVDSVGDAANEAMSEIEALGGLLFGQETSTDGVNRTVLTFRVRPGDFQEAVSRLGGIGELRDQSISSEDVTARVTDLRSQIITAEASVERLREFLTGATGLEEVARLEGQLLERETVLERLRGQLRVVQERVDLATITVVLTQTVPGPDLVLTQTVYKGIDQGVSCQGEESLTLDAQDRFTVCFRIDNAGDTHLTDITVLEENLDITGLDVVLTEGSLNGALAPGERVVGYFEAKEVSDSVSIETRVSAKVINEAGEDLGVARVGDRGNGFVEVRETDALPGFKDSLDSGLDVLAKLIGIAVILVGLFLPFIWIPIAIWIVIRLLRGRRNTEQSRNEPTPARQVHEDPAGTAASDTDVNA